MLDKICYAAHKHYRQRAHIQPQTINIWGECRIIPSPKKEKNKIKIDSCFFGDKTPLPYAIQWSKISMWNVPCHCIAGRILSPHNSGLCGQAKNPFNISRMQNAVIDFSCTFIFSMFYFDFFVFSVTKTDIWPMYDQTMAGLPMGYHLHAVPIGTTIQIKNQNRTACFAISLLFRILIEWSCSFWYYTQDSTMQTNGVIVLFLLLMIDFFSLVTYF